MFTIKKCILTINIHLSNDVWIYNPGLMGSTVKVNYFIKNNFIKLHEFIAKTNKQRKQLMDVLKISFQFLWDM